MSALFLLSLVLRPLCCCGHAGFWKCCHAVYTENLQPGITNKRRQWWGTVVLLSLHLAAPNALASLWELLTLQEGSTGAVKERLQAAPTQEIQSPVCSLGWIHIPREFPPLSPSFLLSPSPFLLSPLPFPSLSLPFLSLFLSFLSTPLLSLSLSLFYFLSLFLSFPFHFQKQMWVCSVALRVSVFIALPLTLTHLCPASCLSSTGFEALLFVHIWGP